MGGEIRNQYRPNQVSPPGDTLLETIESLGMTRADFADRTGLPQETIDQIIRGEAPITPEVALRFERVTGVPADFWNRLERQYRAFLSGRGDDS